jgi:hypothetical protein
MDTKPLERFATQSRRDLLAAVDAQLTVVLSPGSVAQSERAEVVKRLVKEIATHGRAHVIDKVAYTWFNRIIALRFMDARGYTDAGVVSPAQGQTHGQPEILADAKRGNLDTDVVINNHATDAIIGLLDGTRRSTDAEGEAYALLLTHYCRYWHKAMPLMFEGDGDYNELLVPTGLLAGGAILSRVRAVLTEEVCDDVEVIGWLYQFYISERKDEVFAGFKKNKKAGADEIPAATQLFTPHWIVRYLVENSLGRLWMLNRPTSKLVDQMEYYIAPIDEETDFLKIARPEELTVIDPACGSGHMLTYAFDLLYAIYEEEGYAPSEIPGLILMRNLFGTEIDLRAGSLAAFALTMKARAKQRTFFNKKVDPKVCVIEPISFDPDELDFLVTKGKDRLKDEAFWNCFVEANTRGALTQVDEDRFPHNAQNVEGLAATTDILHDDTIRSATRVVRQAEILAGKFHVVVTNPPYLGGRTLSPELGAFLKKHYPQASSDLYSAFLVRGISLVRPGGYSAQVTMHSWLALQSFLPMREHLASQSRIICMAHMDENVMGIAFGTTATIWQKKATNDASVSFASTIHRVGMSDIVDGTPKDKFRRESDFFSANMDSFLELNGSPFAYWLSEDELRVYLEHRPLSEYAETRQGLATGDNERFLRYWWEVENSTISRSATFEDFGHSEARWVPLQKGGPSTRWYGNDEFVISYTRRSRDVLSRQGNRLPSRQHYFRAGLTWSSLSRAFSVRYAPAGQIFETKGSMMFLKDETISSWLLAYLNTGIAQELMDSISPTLDYHEGPVSRLPVILPTNLKRVSEASKSIVEFACILWASRETARSFVPGWLDLPSSSRLIEVAASTTRRLCSLEDSILALEAEIDQEFRASARIGQDSFSAAEKGPTGLLPSPYRSETSSKCQLAIELVSFAVGSMFGRYSPEVPGLILADQGETLQDYLAKVPSPTFHPDADNVIPFVDDGWFEDDIVERFRQFLRAAFGVEHFEENLRFIEESLGVKTLRDYFITQAGKSKFYEDHVQRYKKRPIYWMFSSPEGSFNALIYMHRYNPSTVSTVLNEYLREYRAKLEVALANAEQSVAGEASAKDQKEADRLRKVLAELRDYEHDVLYPLATQQIAINLDDGVKANYPKFYPALKKIVGLEVSDG